MPLKINDFVIQAKVVEEGSTDDTQMQEEFGLPSSVKKEIIDECMEKVKEYIERTIHHQ